MFRTSSKLSPLSLHDALPICVLDQRAQRRLGDADGQPRQARADRVGRGGGRRPAPPIGRSEEHTSELQSRFELVCRLLLEKKILANDPTHPMLPCITVNSTAH